MVADRPLSVSTAADTPPDLEGLVQLTNPHQDWARLAGLPGLIPELSRLEDASPEAIASLVLGPRLAQQLDLSQPLEIGTFKGASRRLSHVVGSFAVRRYGDAALTLLRYYDARRTHRDSYRFRGGANPDARLLDASIACELVRVGATNAGRLLCATTDELTPERVHYLASRAVELGQLTSAARVELPGRVVRGRIDGWLNADEVSLDPKLSSSVAESVSDLERLAVGFLPGPSESVYVEVELEYATVAEFPTALLPESGRHVDALPGLSLKRHRYPAVASFDQPRRDRPRIPVRAVLENLAEPRQVHQEVCVENECAASGEPFAAGGASWVLTFGGGFEEARSNLVREIAREERAEELAVARALLDQWVWGFATEFAKDWLAQRRPSGDGVVRTSSAGTSTERPTYADVARSASPKKLASVAATRAPNERVWLCVEPAFSGCSNQMTRWLGAVVGASEERQHSFDGTREPLSSPRWLLVGASTTPTGGGLVRMGIQLSKSHALQLLQLLSR